MSRGVFNFLIIFSTVILAISFSGCTVIFQKGRRVDVEKISRLKNELSELERAKKELEDRLSKEISDKEVKVEMLEKGLVITFVAEVLFDSGKADLKDDSLQKLEKVSSVLKTTVVDLNVGVEGHTDNEPIKHSSWKSNWELSSARALSVLHYLIEKDVAPERLAATGYGEYHPMASNDSKEGRQKNRRVEIVILPKAAKQPAEEMEK
ncbi:MAG: OmpA family protein [Candidatus Omnitrophica bacterium]|nr:OmpA family protein [Candidatus Omnitrophota bacterium]